MEKLPSSKLIFLFLFLGFFSGIYLDKNDSFLGFNYYNFFELFGSIFINSLKWRGRKRKCSWSRKGKGCKSKKSN